MPLPDAIRTADDLRQLLEQMNEELGWGFHPDTRFADYVNLSTDERTYTPEEAAVRDALIKQAFDLVGDDIYTTSLDVVYQWAGIRYDERLDELVYCDTNDPIRGFHHPDCRPPDDGYTRADHRPTAELRAYLRGAGVRHTGTRREVESRYLLARRLAARYSGKSIEEIGAQPGDELRAQVRALGHRWSRTKRELATFLHGRFGRQITPCGPAKPHRRMCHVWVTYPDGSTQLWGRTEGQPLAWARQIADSALQRESERASREGYPSASVVVRVVDVPSANAQGTEERSGQS